MERERSSRQVGMREYRFASRLLIENYDNRENLRAVLKRSPEVGIAIFHGTADEVIPVRMGRALAQEFPVIDYHEVRSANHGTVINDARAQVIAAMNAE